MAKKSDKQPENDNATPAAATTEPPSDERQETLPNVPRGTPEPSAPADDAAPYGRDSEGRPLNKDGSVRQRPGRKRRDGDADADSADAKDAPKAPRVRKPRIEITADAPGFFTAAADAIRCDNARANARKWLPVSRVAVRMAESGAGAMALSRAKSGALGPKDEAVVAVSALPAMRAVKCAAPDGTASDVETVIAQSISIVAAYFAPETLNPDHPILHAVIATGSALSDYKRACDECIREALEKHHREKNDSRVVTDGER